MTAAAAKLAPIILRNAAGEPPLGSEGAFFRDDQGEISRHPIEAYRSPATDIGILELDSGEWLAKPPSFAVSRPRYPNRELALRAAISAMIRRARKYMRNKDGEGTQWSEGYAGRVIEWAQSLIPDRDLRSLPDETLVHIFDPVVKDLVAAHRARKTFPAGHTFSMTNPVLAGAIKTVGTCTCGHIFVFPGGDHERMDAAIEAHWQKFDASLDKIDGRGQPIGGEAPPAKPKKQRKRKQPDAPEGIPASIIADAGSLAALRSEPAPLSPGAGSSPSDVQCGTCEDAPIGAASTEVSEPPRVEALSNAEIDPVREAGLGGGSLALSMAAEPSDDWSPLLSAALDVAWREPPPVSDVQRALLDFGKVYALPRKVEHPVLRWHGGKWKLAPWIISHFPPHKVYIEPFGGAGSVLLQKLPVLTEVWNDLEGEVVNLFRVLRSSADELARLIYLTPFSREEYHSLYGACDDPVERARQFVARSFMGQSSKGALRKSGFDSRINPDGFASRLNSLRAMPEEFFAIAERFRNVIIEQKPAAEIFAQYDRPDVLFYVDPPYLSDRAKHYTHELDEAGHAALLETLKSLAGMAVVSGYRSELHDEALTGWRRIEIDAHADGGIDRTEVVWLNPACTAALDQQMPALFDLAAHDVANTPPKRT